MTVHQSDESRASALRSRVVADRLVRSGPWFRLLCSSLGLTGAIAVLVSTSRIVSAQDFPQALPPPPSIPNSLPADVQSILPPLTPLGEPSTSVTTPAPPQSAPESLPDLPAAAPTVPEQVFQAPPAMPMPMGRYSVYVNGDSPYLLQQVRMVEPTAFLQTYQGRRVIQVGLFNDTANAQQRVAALGAYGIGAEVVPTSGEVAPSAGIPPTPANSQSPYTVVIPATPSNFAVVAGQAVQLGVRPDAIQQRYAPLGPHLAIGPFTDAQTAEITTRQLRDGGLDARVVFNR